MNLENVNVQEMNLQEITSTNGGCICQMFEEDLELSSSGTDNKLIYAAEAVYNGFALFFNYVINHDD